MLTSNLNDDKGLNYGYSPDAKLKEDNYQTNKIYSEYKGSGEFNQLSPSHRLDFINIIADIRNGTSNFQETAEILDKTEALLKKIEMTADTSLNKSQARNYVVDEITRSLSTDTMRTSINQQMHDLVKKLTVNSDGTEQKLTSLVDTISRQVESNDIQGMRSNIRTLVNEMRSVDFLPFSSQGTSFDNFSLLENELLQSLMLLDKRYYSEHVKDDGTLGFSDKRAISSKKDLYNLLKIPDQTKLLEDAKSTSGLYNKINQVVVNLRSIGQNYDAQKIEKWLDISHEKKGKPNR